MELTKTQRELYEYLTSTIKTARQSKDIKEFYVNSRLKYLGERSDYEEVKRHEEERFDILSEDEITFYTKIYEMAKENIVRTYANSNTIRALEKKGYIEIITDAANSNKIDKVKILREVL